VNAFGGTDLYEEGEEDGLVYVDNCLVKADTEISGTVTVKDGTVLIADYAISNCDKITELKLPGSLRHMGEDAIYDCDLITRFDIPSGMETVDSYSIVYCIGLTEVYIPRTVKQIGTAVFGSCSNIKTVYYEGTEAEWNEIEIGNSTYLTRAERVYLGKDEPDEAIPGDLNGDGALNAMDSNIMKRILAGVVTPSEEQMANADFDSNGNVDSIDSNLMAKAVSGKA
jgi:hypothetical protein